MSIAGLAGLIFGGNLFVDSATDLARMLGVSDKFIAVTILAGGTSLPELATSLVAALKGRDQLALGNILGSNVFNILLILGSSALITPLSLGSVTYIDALVLTLSMILSLLWAYTGNRERIDRWEGIVMLLLYKAGFKREGEDILLQKKAFDVAHSCRDSLKGFLEGKNVEPEVNTDLSGGVIRVEAYYNASAAVAYVQLFDFSNYTYEPATEVVELRGPMAEKLIGKL